MKRYERYKDSGVEWLGEVPEHWRTLRMKYAFNERSQKDFQMNHYYLPRRCMG